MTTLYEHQVLGDKIVVVNAKFNIPFLVGEGYICLYREGIALIDESGEEKYIIEFNGFEVRYDSFVNTKKIKYISKDKVYIKNSKIEVRNVKKLCKRVNGGYYGKLIITIPNLGDIELFDNHLLKYRDLYVKIEALKKGENPIEIYNNKVRLFTKLFKIKLF